MTDQPDVPQPPAVPPAAPPPPPPVPPTPPVEPAAEVPPAPAAPSTPEGYQPPVYEPQPAPVAPPKKRLIWPWILGGGIFLFLALIATVIIIVVNVAAGALSGPSKAVLDFDKAFATSDCKLYEKVTTSDYRDALFSDGGYSCEAFTTAADAYKIDGDYKYKVTVTSTQISNSEATVGTTEVDSSGTDPVTTDYTYHLVQQSGAWVITQIE